MQWDANTEDDLAGYKVYYRIGSYGKPYDGVDAIQGPSPIRVPLSALSDPAIPTFTLTGLDPAQFYFFAVTAYNNEDPALESGYSKPTGILRITSPEDGFCVNIDNKMSYPISGKGLPGALVEIFAGNIKVGETIPDPEGSWSISADFSLVVAGGINLTAVSAGSTSYPVSGRCDFTAPQITSSPSITLHKDTFAIIHWETDESGNSVVEYGPDISYGFTKTGSSYVTHHYVILDDLTPDTTYHYRVSSTDAAGNGPDAEASDSNPSTDTFFNTHPAVAPKIVKFPHIGFDYLLITFDKPNMQNAAVESNYQFNPALNFDTPGISGEYYDIINFTGASYYLSFISMPGYEIFTMTVSNITDVAGNPVTPATIRINDNDDDNIADDWEVAYGLDPADPSDGALNADADEDGYSNYQEYQARTDPQSATSVPFILKDVLPPHNSGIITATGVSNDTSFAVLIESANGINLSDPLSVPDSIVFTVDDGTGVYDRDLSSAAVRFVNLSENDDSRASLLWAIYDRSLDSLVAPGYPFDSDVNVTFNARDINGNEMNAADSDFHTETAAEFDERTNPANLPDIEIVPVTDPDLDTVHDTGIQVSSGELAGAKILYNSGEPLPPTFGPINGISDLTLSQVTGVGIPMNLQPATVFNTPVKIFIPVPGYPDVSPLGIYMFDGIDWLKACDAAGNVLPDGVGWMVPGSRVNHNDRTPAVIEIQVYHFSAVQAGTIVITINSGDDNEGGTSSSGGGSCFIATATFGSEMDWHVEVLRHFRDRLLLPTDIGRKLVDLYYRHSPPIADYLSGNALTRMIVRQALIPLAGLAWMVLNFHVVVMIFGALLVIYLFNRRPTQTDADSKLNASAFNFEIF